MQGQPARIKRERSTIQAMISIYCRDFHGERPGICPDCEELQEYAMQRLDRCVFKDEKPTCVKCPVHCYRKEMREKVRVVMRYAGPKMLIRHPVLAVLHLIDGKKKPPALPKRKSTGS
jgi:predicted amidophosphoribosyltransferase